MLLGVVEEVVGDVGYRERCGGWVLLLVVVQ